MSSECSPSTTSTLAAQMKAFVSFRRQQVVSTEHNRFLANLQHKLNALMPSKNKQQNILNMQFIAQLLDTLLNVETQFRDIISSDTSSISIDRTLADLVDRTLKSLDIFNAVSLSLNTLRQWNRQAAAAAAAVRPPNKSSGDGPINRCRRTLHKLLLDSSPSTSSSHMRALPSSFTFFSRLLSASTSSNLLDVSSSSSSSSLGVAVYSMSAMLVFCMWVMEVSVRRGNATAYAPAHPLKHMPWSESMVALQDGIIDECRREEKNGNGLFGMIYEIVAVEKCAKRLLASVGDDIAMPSTVSERATEVADACREVDDCLGALEKKVRDVFHRIVGCRAELMRCIDNNGK